MSLIDIHCHPSMKINLFGHHLYSNHHPAYDLLPTGMSVDLPGMEKGKVNAAISVHYLPEAGLLKNSVTLTDVAKIKLPFIQNLINKFEDDSSSTKPFFQLLEIIQRFENDVRTSRVDYGFKVDIARSFTHFKQLINDGFTVFIHSVEGANALGAGLDAITLEREITNLFELGVCQFTVAHFFENIIAQSQGGIPPHTKRTLKYSQPPKTFEGLNPTSNLGELAIKKMLDLGIIVDLVHCTNQGKEEIYAINDARGGGKRPLVFSHTGLREVALKYNPGMNRDDQLYLPDATDVIKIKECGGTLGVIFMNYWLDGIEEDNPLRKDVGLPLVIETIQKIAEICGNYEHISIGSDLDGFTQTPDDLSSEGCMRSVLQAMRDSGISEGDIERICFGNYLRVLDSGWGKKN